MQAESGSDAALEDRRNAHVKVEEAMIDRLESQPRRPGAAAPDTPAGLTPPAMAALEAIPAAAGRKRMVARSVALWLAEVPRKPGFVGFMLLWPGRADCVVESDQAIPGERLLWAMVRAPEVLAEHRTRRDHPVWGVRALFDDLSYGGWAATRLSPLGALGIETLLSTGAMKAITAALVRGWVPVVIAASLPRNRLFLTVQALPLPSNGESSSKTTRAQSPTGATW